MNAASRTGTQGIGRRTVVLTMILTLLSWSFVVLTPTASDASHPDSLEIYFEFLQVNPDTGEIVDREQEWHHITRDTNASAINEVLYGEEDDFSTAEARIAGFAVQQVHVSCSDEFDVPVDAQGDVVAVDHDDFVGFAQKGAVLFEDPDGGHPWVIAPRWLEDGSAIGAYRIENLTTGSDRTCGPLGALTLEKLLDGSDTDWDGQDFTFTLFQGGAVVETLENPVTLSESPENFAEFPGLTPGDHALCETALGEGWEFDVAVSGESATVYEAHGGACVDVTIPSGLQGSAGGATVAILWDNLPPPPTPTGEIELIKTLDGDEDLGEESFSFELFDDEGAQAGSATLTGEDNEETFEDLALGTYELCETGFDDDTDWAFEVEVDGSQETAVFVEDQGWCVDVEVAEDGVTVAVDWDNLPPDEPVGPAGFGSLSLEKDVEGDGATGEKSFGFEIECTDGTTASPTLEDGQSWGPEPLEVGTRCEITEVDDDAADATSITVQPEEAAVDSGDDPPSVTVEITEEDIEVVVTFTNIFDQESVLPGEIAPDIELVKEADVETAELGDEITYTYTVTNTGNTTLEDLVLDDDVLGEVTLESTTLEPGESTTGTATHTVTEDDVEVEEVYNIAVVTGWSPEGVRVSDEDDETVVIEILEVLDEALVAEDEALPRTGFDALQLLLTALFGLAFGGAILLSIRLQELRGREYGV